MAAVLKDKFLIRTGGSKAPDPPQPPPSPPKGNEPPKKRKKLPVGKESTLKSWGLDWLGMSRNQNNALKIHCISCRQLAQKTTRNNRGAASIDPSSSLQGTTNTKKSSALRTPTAMPTEQRMAMESSDTEDEVFFGPVLGREAKRAGKLRRKTEIFKPDFRHHLPPTSSSASSELGEDDVFDRASTEQDSISQGAEARNGQAGVAPVGSLDESRSDIFAEGSFRSSPHVTLRSFSERSLLRDSPLSRSVEKRRNGKGEEEEKESPFQRKTRALLDLIHKTKEEWSSPTQSPLSVCSMDTPLKRKLHESTASPLLDYSSTHSVKISKLSSGAEVEEHPCDNHPIPLDGSLEGEEHLGSREGSEKSAERNVVVDPNERSGSAEDSSSESPVTSDSPLEKDPLPGGNGKRRPGQFEVDEEKMLNSLEHKQPREAQGSCDMEAEEDVERNLEECESSDISGSGTSTQSTMETDDSRLVSIEYVQPRVAPLGESRVTEDEGSYVFRRKPLEHFRRYDHSHSGAGKPNQSASGNGDYQQALVEDNRSSGGSLPGMEAGKSKPSKNRIHEQGTPSPTESSDGDSKPGAVDEQSGEEMSLKVDGGRFHQSSREGTSSISQTSLSSQSDSTDLDGSKSSTCSSRSSAFQPVKSGLVSLSASQEPLQIVPFQTSTPTQPSARTSIFRVQNPVTVDHHHSFKSDSWHSLVGSENDILTSKEGNSSDKFLVPKGKTGKGKVTLVDAAEPNEVRFSPILQNCTNIVSRRRPNASQTLDGSSVVGSPSAGRMKGQEAIATPTRRGVENDASVPVNLFTAPQGGLPSTSSPSVSLRKRLLEQKQAQLMRVKQAKAELEQRILETDEQQFQLRMRNMSALRSTMNTLKEYSPSANVCKIQDSPSTSLDEGSFDELTKYCTWRNSQLVEDGEPPNESLVQPGKRSKGRSHLQWMEDLVVEVAELSSPSKPATRGKSILMNK